MGKRKFNRLKVVLAEREKTNLWLAGKLGINKTTVSKWCTNDVQPSSGNLLRIAKVLDVDVRELLNPTKN